MQRSILQALRPRVGLFLRKFADGSSASRDAMPALNGTDDPRGQRGAVKMELLWQLRRHKGFIVK
jgi:hypothetical protein